MTTIGQCATKIAVVALLCFVFLGLMAMSFDGRRSSVNTNLVVATQIGEAATSLSSPSITPALTATATVTPTAVYPPSIQDIKNALHPELEEIQDILGTSNQPSGLLPSPGSIRDNLISSLIWDVLGSPVLTWLLTALGSISIVGKVFTRFKINQSTSNGQTINPAITLVDRFANVLMSICMIIFIGLFLYLSVKVPSQAEIATPIDVAAVNTKLDRIETQLQDLLKTRVITTTVATILPTQIPTPLPTIVNAQPFADELNSSVTGPILLIIPLFLVILIIAVIWTIRYIREIRHIYSNTSTIDDSIQLSGLSIDTGLIAAILLALIIVLLPYPADVFILPVIVPYLVFTFFELIIQYPSMALKEFMARRYSFFVFLAVFGSWISLVEAISHYMSPIWESFSRVITELLFFSSSSRENIVGREIAWSLLTNLLTLILALIISVPISIRLQQSVAQHIIPKLRHSIDSGRIVE